MKSVTTAQLAQLMQDGEPTLIDVREPHEFSAGHVKGAINIPLKTLPGRLDSLDHEAATYAICQSGHRSSNAVRLMKRSGFTNAINVQGGTSAWRGKLVK